MPQKRPISDEGGSVMGEDRTDKSKGDGNKAVNRNEHWG